MYNVQDDGYLEASEEEVIAAARKANAHNFIMGFPDGYDTVVGERGVRYDSIVCL